MSIEHIVAEDEHLAAIAAQHGFSKIEPIWLHPNNAELKALRKSPHTLLAGDRVFIPDLAAKQVDAATGQRTTFATAGNALELHLKVHDQGFQPIKGSAELTTPKGTVAMTQNGDVFEAPLAADDRSARVVFPAGEGARQRPSMIVRPGRLDPINTMSGQQQRLNNLGYFAGFAQPKGNDPKKPDDQFRWAVEEFQCDHMKKEQIDGILGPETRDKLEKVYGC